MKENDEEFFWNSEEVVSSMENSGGSESGSLRECNGNRHHQRYPGHREPESSEVLRKYLRSLGYCGRKKRRRGISQDLGR